MNKHRQNLTSYPKYSLLLCSFTFLFLLPYSLLSQCPGTSCTFTISGPDSGTYLVNTGEKICFDPNADFTGTIDLEGGELINCATNPQIFTFSPGAFGVINNYGIFEFPSNYSITSGLTFNNYQTINADQNLTVMSGGIFNNIGTSTILGLLSNQNQVDNSGTLTITDVLSESGSSTLTNSGAITASGWTVNGTWDNSGTIDIVGTFLMGTGKTGTINGGCLSSNTWTNRGTITGNICGDINIAGVSTLSSSGSLLGDIAIIDATPPGSSPFIDNNLGIIDPTIVYTSCNDCSSTAEEICANSTDDNGDGRIDEPYPGGVQSNMQLWLKAEMGTNTTTDGIDVTSWTDQSANGYSANADGASTDNPVYSDNELNYNPGIVFDGTYTDDSSDGLHLGSDYIYSTNSGIHIFAVINPAVGGNQYDKVFDFGGTVFNGYGLGWFSSSTRSNTPTSFGGATSFLNHGIGIEPSLLEFEIKFNNSQTVFKDGNTIVSTTGLTLSQLTAAEIAESDHYGTVANGDHLLGPVSIGRKSASQFLDQDRVFMGAISEVLVYNDTLTQIEKEKIQSYLAIKYGITMLHNYTSSSEITIKNISDGYANSILGIGRDDCSGLNQKQSKSVEDDGIVTLSIGDIAANNQSNANTFSTDENFLVVGNDGQTVNSWSVIGGVITDSRIDRTWKIDNTNINQSITFTIDMDDPDNNIVALSTGALSGYKIIFDQDGDFTNGESLTTTLINTTGSLYEVTLPLGSWQYFTIVHEAAPLGEICGNSIDDNGDGRIDEIFPGGVQQDMQLWLKAETGTNTIVDGNDVTAWGDQSVNGYSANADVNSTDDPTFSENAINFNPGVDFDGSFTDGYSDGLHLGSDYIYGIKDGLHVFVVCDPDVVSGTDKHIFDFGLAANGGYGMIYSDNDYGMYTNNAHGGTNTELFHSAGEAPALVEMKVDFDDAQEFYRNGSLLSSIAVTIPDLDETKVTEAPAYGPALTSTNSGPVSIGRKSASTFLDLNGGRLFDGRISEVIVFTDTLSSLEKQKVNSYLAIKYGLTINENYLSSTGSIKKDISDGYANDIAGIGKDDCSGLHQKQSKSIESDAIVTVGKTTIAATNQINGNSIPTDESYLIWGNNGAPINANWNTANVTIPGANFSSIDRTWKLSESLNITDALFQIEVDNLNFDLPPMPPTADGIYYLLRDDDGDFTNGGTTYEPMTLATGDKWQTTLANPTSEFFSIAVGTACGAQAPTLSK